MKTIALDYDGTYTDNVKFWSNFVMLANSMGQPLIVVTARHGDEAAEVAHQFSRNKVYYTSGMAKKKFLKMHGYGKKDIIYVDNDPKGVLKNDDTYVEEI